MLILEGANLKSNHLLYPIGIVIISSLLLYMLYRLIFIKRIHVSIPSLIYAAKADNYNLHNQETIVHIQGEIHNQLFRESYFAGTIWVDNYKPWMAEPTQVRFPLEENNMFFYCFQAEPGDHYCYVYLDDNGEEVALLFPGGIHVAGPATNKVEVEKVLSRSWGYQKVEYETHTLADFIYSNQEFCFGCLRLNQSNKKDTLDQNKDSVLKSTTDNGNRSELRYQKYLYFKDVKVAADNVQYNFEEDLLREISIQMSYTSEESYHQSVTDLKNALTDFPSITVYDSINSTCFKDSTGNGLILRENTSDYTFIIRIKKF